MGAETPLTEESVLVYLNKREDMTMIARNQLLADERPLSEDERAALHFYAQNPSAALFDFGRRISDRRVATEAPLPEPGDLLRELDWCLAHGHAGPRTRAVLSAAALTLAGGRAITGAEKARLLQLAQKHRSSASDAKATENYARLERFVASLLAVRVSPEKQDNEFGTNSLGSRLTVAEAFAEDKRTLYFTSGPVSLTPPGDPLKL
ncbi:hypothetical protein G3A43_08555 [Paraburkholderia aspalathi]|nr:hypothetical protein [Paraburkholderia aspalathi]MBK3780307.1 hypothetical protein [Paraburkholderia aspalathi]